MFLEKLIKPLDEYFMIDRFVLISIIIILVCFNITQYYINHSYSIKLAVQNSAIIQEKKEQDRLIKQRDGDLKKLSEQYKKDIAFIKSKNLEQYKDTTCPEILDLIVVSMKQVDGMPDNP